MSDYHMQRCVFGFSVTLRAKFTLKEGIYKLNMMGIQLYWQMNMIGNN